MNLEGLAIIAWTVFVVISILSFIFLMFQSLSLLVNEKISRMNFLKYVGLGAVGVTAFIFVTRWILYTIF